MPSAVRSAEGARHESDCQAAHLYGVSARDGAARKALRRSRCAADTREDTQAPEGLAVMAWSWSHTADAYADAQANCEALPRDTLLEIAAEWEAHDRSPDDSFIEAEY